MVLLHYRIQIDGYVALLREATAFRPVYDVTAVSQAMASN